MKESTSGRKPKLTKQELIDNIYTAHSSGVIDIENCELTSNEVRQKVFDGSCDHKRVRDAFHEAQAVISKLSVGKHSTSAIQSHRPAYQLRHSYASKMLSKGADHTWLAKQMGHANWGLIQKIYGKWIEGDNPDSFAELSAKFDNEL